ncbi:hypothetical protein GWK47_002084 [Chionoecetes opilio]|uniref:Uncharacterized protein n=1 Tax=Chionoecetes opilio TaxID=41210 RepID=A0A8J5CGM6_CHIOP|nr:hypothetical protein GWK47_002084 [Chionoecetes opilio]
MLLECFPNTSRIHMDATFGWSMKIILNMHNKFLELPNAVPYASVRSRTASMLLEHTECFPNMIRSLPEHPNSYSENKRNGIRPNVIGPVIALKKRSRRELCEKKRERTAAVKMFHILETRPTKVRWCWLARERGTSTASPLVSIVLVLRVAILGGCRNPARCGTPCTCALWNTTSAATSLRCSSESRGLTGSDWAGGSGGSAASTSRRARCSPAS